MKVTADASVRHGDDFRRAAGLRTAATVAWPQRKQTIALSAISVPQFAQTIGGRECRRPPHDEPRQPAKYTRLS
jgi:hypothetical protein